ncbi:MAG: hypothetical protein ACYSUI_22295 [Planctomycetota bacterium]|jgi:hypothetical protein
MKYVTRLGAVAVALAMVALLAAPAFADGTTKVGYFLIRMAEFKNVHATDSRMAADALRTVGVRVPSDLDHDAALTEAVVARLSKLAGVRVTTSTPDRLFTATQVERFFGSFGDELAQNGAMTRACEGADCENPGNPDVDPQAPFDPFAKGKGKKKGKAKRPVTPTEPE